MPAFCKRVIERPWTWEGHDPSMLELLGVGEDSIVDQYCDAVAAYVSKRCNYRDACNVMGQRHVV